MTLVETLEAAARDAADVVAQSRGGATEWSTRGEVFAATAAETAEFRLDPVVVGAALGTPNVGGSRRGPDWVAFSPPELDRFAIDRAVAWFGSAYRRAARSR